MPDRGLILIAEDREDDIVLIRRALEKAGVKNPTHVVRNGEETIAYLKGEASASSEDGCRLPALLLLDLNMPRVDGFDVLRWIRLQPEFKALRVIVFTSSDDIHEANLAYELGANSFMVKPTDFNHSVEICKFLKEYWLRKARDPEHSHSTKS